MAVSLDIFKKSKFRSSFKLKTADLLYIKKVGLERVESHAQDFIKNKLASENPKNDGKQTPFRGHPVFISQHATATCCRSCLNRWHGITKGKALTQAEIGYIKQLIMEWIKDQIRTANI